MNAASHTAPVRTRFPSVLIDRIELADGRSVIVRPVVAIDAPAEQEFVRAMSVESRHKRFHMTLQELSPELLRQFTDVDHVGHVAIVAESLAPDTDEDDAATIVADARYVIDGDETHLAIAVADAWQGVGLGKALMQRLLRYASRHGIRRLVADMLPGNAAMARLAMSCGARIGASPLEPGLRRAHFEVPSVLSGEARRTSALPVATC
ncbi:MAG: GNAT family N-acetyltransferase [Variovorax sp.]